MKENVRQCLQQQEARARVMLEREVYGSRESFDMLEEMMSRFFPMVLGQHLGEGNDAIARLADWFNLPHPQGKDLRGECDFIAMKLCRAWHLLRDGRIIPDNIERIRRFFLQNDFSSKYQSENHALLYHSARYLMAQSFRNDHFEAYGKTGAELIPLEIEWLQNYLRFRAQRGWGEFDSSVYLCPVWEALCGLYDYAEDAALKETVHKMMDLLLVDMSVDSLQGMYGGAHGRIYPPQALNHEDDPTRVLQYLYFGLFEALERTRHSFLLDALCCAYTPDPVVVDIALNRERSYENRERKHLHNVADIMPLQPLDGSIRKYTYWTPQYVIGAVQYQDAYPVDAPRSCDCLSHPLMALHGKVDRDQSDTIGYALHQQHQWDLSFADKPKAKIFTHHPGIDGTHSHWTGDRLCGCNHTFQNRNAVVALYDIPAREPLQWIHAYVPRAEFDEVVEREGVLFVRSAEAYAALRLLSGYHWTSEGEWKDVEVVSNGPRHGVICEAGTKAEFANFADFQQEILGNAIRYDGVAMTLAYDSKRNGLLEIDTCGIRRLNGRPAALDYATYDCPYMRSDWKSGHIEMTSPSGASLTLDF